MAATALCLLVRVVEPADTVLPSMRAVAVMSVIMAVGGDALVAVVGVLFVRTTPSQAARWGIRVMGEVTGTVRPEAVAVIAVVIAVGP